MDITMENQPNILKESAQIKRENLVGNIYVISEEDLTSEVMIGNQYVELINHIKNQLNIETDLNISVVESDLIEIVLQDLKK